MFRISFQSIGLLSPVLIIYFNSFELFIPFLVFSLLRLNRTFRLFGSTTKSLSCAYLVYFFVKFFFLLTFLFSIILYFFSFFIHYPDDILSLIIFSQHCIFRQKIVNCRKLFLNL